MENQICPDCKSEIKKIEVEIEDAKSKIDSYQCSKCGYFSFEPENAMRVIEEIKTKESPLRIKQKIIKLSKDRLGIYFNKDIIESLNLESGGEILVSVPNKRKLVLDIC